MPSPTKNPLRLNELEARAVPAATATLSAGTLSVIGTAAADTITVTETGGVLSVTGVKIMHGGVLKSSVPAGLVAKVFVTGGPGSDIINISTVTKKGTIIGGLANDSITGGLGNDDIYGRDGHDSIFGSAGSDTLFGENGNDTLWGDDDDDTIYGGTGNDVLAGRAGNDVLYCESGNDLGSGADGNDKVYGNTGDDSLFGGVGNDELLGEDGNDVLEGNEGNDTANGGNGNDTVVGNDGDDELTGLNGNDSNDGGLGNDSIYCGAGNDKANGGLGDDFILGDDGVDTLHGDDGNDIVAGGAGSDFVYGDNGNDIVAADILGDIVDGGLGDDTISAGSGDVINGGGGSDTVIAGGGEGGDTGNDNQDPPGGGSNGAASVFQTIRSQWADGTTNDITVRNVGSSNINGWKIEFDADFDITEQWNVQLVSRDGAHYTFRNIPGFWNTLIRPNTQITFGFNARLDAGNSRAIRNIEFNDQPLSGGGVSDPPPNPSTQGTVTPAIRSQWTGGLTLDLTIRNTGAGNMSGWTVSFDADFDVTEVWNAQLIGRNGNRYTIRNIPNFWNAVIAPNNQITIGFNGLLGAGDITSISNITLNGNPM